MSSGIPVSSDCMDAFTALKAGKSHGYVIMSIRDNKSVELDESGQSTDKNCSQADNEKYYNENVYEKLMADEQKDPKYVLFDVRRQTKDGDRTDIVLINWCPDECTDRKKKMTQSSTFNNVKLKMTEAKKAIQANDADELSYKSILEEFQKK